MFWERMPCETEFINSTAITEVASQIDGKLLARCLEKPWAFSLTLDHPVNPLLQKLEGEYNSDPVISGALGKYRDSILHAHILHAFMMITDHEVRQALARGVTPSHMEVILGIYKEAALDLSRQEGRHPLRSDENVAISESGVLNLNCGISALVYGRNHILQRQLLWRHRPPVE
jgi:hypothetical protein